jgi:hypothetical protein
MMEASALLNLDGFSKAAGGGKSVKGEGMKKKDPKPPAAPANGDASGAGNAPPQQQQQVQQQQQQVQQQQQQQVHAMSSQAPASATLGVQPPDRCVKPTTYVGEAPLGAHAAPGAAPYNGDIPPSTGIAPPPAAPMTAPMNGLHQVQLVQQSAAAAAAAAQAEAQRASVHQQAQQVQQHQQAQQAQMQEASNAF